jgi:SAM-dependent methyltransferase
MDPDDPAYRGQSEYTNSFLRVYDTVILGFFLRFVWRCPSSRLVELYRQHIRDRHLDVGPGTGYFIERSGLPDGSEVTILDPNQNVLDYVTHRLRRLQVTAVQADVLKPLPVEGLFKSAALHGVIHCLPGPLTRKAAAVTHVAAVLAPDGVLFGMSILGSSGPQSWLSRRMLRTLNRRGTFDNLTDTDEWLNEILAASFEQVELETIGSVAIFVATKPRMADRTDRRN